MRIRHPTQKPGERPDPKEPIKPAYGKHNPAKPTTDKKELGVKAKHTTTPDGKPLTVVEGDIPGVDEFLDVFNGELMSDADYTWAAEELGVEEAAIRAYTKVESGAEKGARFIGIGKRKVPTILYERHKKLRKRSESHKTPPYCVCISLWNNFDMPSQPSNRNYL